MKRFVIKISAFLLIVSIVSITINGLYMNLRNTEFSKYQNVPSDIRLCNFGSSHGVHSYRYVDIPVSCFNFALDSQSLSYDARILSSYQNHLSKDAVVIIDISYFAFFGPDETEQGDFTSKNKRYYSILPPEYIKEYDFYTHIMAGKLPALSDGPISVLKAFFSKFFNNPSLDTITATTTHEAALESGMNAALRHIGPDKRDSSGQLLWNREEEQALRDMVSLCRDRGITPILVTVPYLQEYTDAISEVDPTFFNTFYQYIDQFVLETGVEYFDYSQDSRYSKSYEFFYNADHMNDLGAQSFTNLLYDEVLSKIMK